VGRLFCGQRFYDVAKPLLKKGILRAAAIVAATAREGKDSSQVLISRRRIALMTETIPGVGLSTCNLCLFGSLSPAITVSRNVNSHGADDPPAETQATQRDPSDNERRGRPPFFADLDQVWVESAFIGMPR